MVWRINLDYVSTTQGGTWMTFSNSNTVTVPLKQAAELVLMPWNYANITGGNVTFLHGYAKEKWHRLDKNIDEQLNAWDMGVVRTPFGQFVGG